MKVRILILIVSICSFSCEFKNNYSRKIIVEKDLKTNYTEEYTLNDDKEKDGFFRIYENEKLIYDAEYKENKINGIIRKYDYYGNLSKYEFYKNGIKEGTSIKFREPGLIESILTFKKDTLNGKCWEFYPNGFIKYLYHYKDGFNIGSNYDFYPNGFLAKYKYFDYEGKLAFYREYDKNGKRIKEDGTIAIFPSDTITSPNNKIIDIEMVTPPNCWHSIQIKHISDNKVIENINYDTSKVKYSFEKMQSGHIKITCELIDSLYIRRQEFEISYYLE